MRRNMKESLFNEIVEYLASNSRITARKNLPRTAKRFELREDEGGNEKYLLCKTTGMKHYSESVLRRIILKLHRQNAHAKYFPLHFQLNNELQIDAPRRFVAKVISNCAVCQSTKSVALGKKAVMHLPVEKGPFKRVQIDLIDLRSRPSRLGHHYIMTIEDCFTKYLWTFPLETKSPHETRFFFDQWLIEYGAPDILQSDNGKEFTGAEVVELFADYELTTVHSSAYYPQTNGKVESLNKKLKNILKAMLVETGMNWIDLLHDATAIANGRFNESIGMSPFEALYGYPRRTTGDGDARRKSRRREDHTPTEAERESVKKRRKRVHEAVTTALHKANKKMLARGGGELITFEQGNTVLYRLPTLASGSKLHPCEGLASFSE